MTTHLSPSSSVDEAGNTTCDDDEKKPEETAEKTATRCCVACQLVNVDVHELAADKVRGISGSADGPLWAQVVVLVHFVPARTSAIDSFANFRSTRVPFEKILEFAVATQWVVANVQVPQVQQPFVPNVDLCESISTFE